VSELDQEWYKNVYVAFRFIEAVSIGAFIFGVMWESSIKFDLRASQFLMLYGAVGATVSEAMARYLKKKFRGGGEGGS